MALAWSSSFANKVKQNTKKFVATPKKTVTFVKPKVVNVSPKQSSLISSKQVNSTNYIATPVVKSAYDLQLEKIARTEAHKNRTANENLKIHSAKIQGETAGNTDNYYVDNKTGEVSKSSQTSNLSTYLKENGLSSLNETSLIPVKLVDERMASQNKTVFLRKEAEIKAQGGSVPELNLLNKEQTSKYNEISNIITQSKPDDSEQALQDVNSSVNSFLSLDNPITQDAKTRGLAQVQPTGIKDSTVISLGFTPEDVGDFQVPESKHKEENKDFVDKKTATGLGIASVGIGLLALVYLLSKKSKTPKRE